ncbi:hypothetical protein [Glaciibacter flavus]
MTYTLPDTVGSRIVYLAVASVAIAGTAILAAFMSMFIAFGILLFA